MSAPERARADSEIIKPILGQFRGGDVTFAQNSSFVRSFLQSLPASERGALWTDTGGLSQEGARRIQAALLYAAYDDGDLVAKSFESANNDIRSIAGALLDAAPAWAALRARAARGEISPDVDRTGDLIAAVRAVEEARLKGVRPDDVFNQGGLFSNLDAARDFGAMFFHDTEMRKSASRQVMGARLRKYIEQANLTSAAPDLFGNAPASAKDILGATKGREVSPDEFAGTSAMAAPTRGPAPGTVSGYAPGANWQGKRHTTFNPATDPVVTADQRGNAVRRETIVSDFARALGSHVYQGKVRSKRMEGFYRHGSGEVRIKARNDLETTVHELAHFTEFSLGVGADITNAYKTNPLFRDELKSLSYDKKKTHEGFAEFVRFWMTQPNLAQRGAPGFLTWWEVWLDSNPALKAAFYEARRAVLAWYDQDILSQAESKIGAPPTHLSWRQWKRAAKDNIDSAVAAGLDDLRGLYLAERELYGSASPNGFYANARLARAAGAIIDSALEFGAPRMVSGGRWAAIDLNGQQQANISADGRVRANPFFQRAGFRKVLDLAVTDGGNLRDFVLFMVGRRAALLKQQGRERLFTEDEIRAMIAVGRPSYVQAAEAWAKMNSQLLDFAQAAGIIDPAGRAKWETNVYVPFWRVTDRTYRPGVSGAGPIPGMTQIIRRLRGGTANVNDILENMVGNIKLLINAGVTNHARAEAARGILSAPNGGRFMARLGRETRGIDIDTEQVVGRAFEIFAINPSERNLVLELARAYQQGDATAIRKAEQAVRLNAPQLEPNLMAAAQFIANAPRFLNFWLHGQAPSRDMGRHIIAWMEDGKPKYAEVADSPEGDLVWRAFDSLPRSAALPWVLRFSGWWRRMTQGAVTRMPTFMATNPARDQFVLAAQSRTKRLPFVHAVAGFKHAIARDAVYREWLSNGGGMSGIYGSESAAASRLRSFYQRRGISPDYVLMGLPQIWRAWKHFGEAFEAASRIAEFKGALRRGMTPREGALLARDVTVDFAMNGDSRTISTAYNLMAFLHATAVAQHKTFRAAVSKETAPRFWGVVGLLSMASLGLWFLNRGNPLYDDLEEWDKNAHYHFFIPRLDALRYWIEHGRLPPGVAPKDLYHHFRMPRPFEMGLPGRLAEIAAEGIESGKYDKAAKKALEAVGDSFRLNQAPAIIQPLLELDRNASFFTGRPIETQGMRNLEAWARSGPFTSSTAEFIGKQLDMSPVKIEHVLRSTFSEAATLSLWAADSLFFSDEQVAKRLDQIPAVRRFYRQEPAAHSVHMTEFYKVLRQADEASSTIRDRARLGRFDEAEELEGRRQRLLEARPYLKGAEKALQTLSRASRLVLETHGLAELQRLASETLSGLPGVSELEGTDAWRDTPTLKREIRDRILTERNLITKNVMEQVGPVLEGSGPGR